MSAAEVPRRIEAKIRTSPARPKAVLKTRAVQTLRRLLGVLEPRKASGLRRVHRRFSDTNEDDDDLRHE